MLQLLKSTLVMTWALWFGGMIALILFVTRLFNTSHDLGVHAAPVLFRVFANYQIIVGMIACAAATLLSLSTRSKVHAGGTAILLAAFAVALVIRMLTNRMLDILAAGQSS